MLFNSIEFALFLPLVFFLYWLAAIKGSRWQNLVLIVANYFFYGWWDWRFLFLIAFSSLVDYLVGLALANSQKPRKRKLLLATSVCVNVGFLGFFKYFNFFADNFYSAFTFFGSPISDPIFLNLVLPVGISFYTFQTISYSIDIYRRKIEPTRDILAFFTFVSFFPQLVAGPIERATNLLPQFFVKREFNYTHAVDGLRQILWGLFKKIVIADGCARYVNLIFSDYQDYSGSTLLLGAILFAFQIYGDFSGYSDIAIGSARLFGVNLRRNFAFPYFSRSIPEFWRRWHISLSSWFRDYVYLPLGGSRVDIWRSVRNIFIVFALSGFWHGANWTFIVWGLLNAVYMLPYILLAQNKDTTSIAAAGRLLPTFKESIQILNTFLLVCIAWVFFRAESVSQAIEYIGIIFSASLFSSPEVDISRILYFILFLVVIEWIQREKQHGLQIGDTVLPAAARWLSYYVLIISIAWYGGKPQEFIYFQF
ncbi:MAG: MBOAT family O-acyltransferase [bacterium]